MDNTTLLIIYCIIGTISTVIILSFFKIVRPNERGVIESWGKYNRFAMPGLNILVPLRDNIKLISISEQMANIPPREIITKDNLNAKADLVVYHKVNEDEESIKKAFYGAQDVNEQIVMLAQTTARNVIGSMNFSEVNSQRNNLNSDIAKVLDSETKRWGVQIVRVELKEITPPPHVQESMNRVIMAQNEKEAAGDLATAAETTADGERRANIKKAEGIKQARILEAEGKALAIKLENEAAEKYFTGNAQTLKKYETIYQTFKDNSKIVVPMGSELINVLGDQNNSVLPLNSKKR